MSGRRRPIVMLASLACVLALALSGCSTTIVEPNQSHAVLTPPSADSPAAVVELVRWAHVNRSPEMYRTLFTDDYVFAFSATDSAGSAYRDSLWTRQDELFYGQHLFVTGKGSEEPATSIMLEYGSTPTALPDPRPGKNPGWHRYVNVDVVMVVRRASGGDVQIQGAVKFYVVRGDSAAIPGDLGVGPDPSRWYIDRWEDDTAQTGIAQRALAPQPASRGSWGQLKSLYR